MLGGVVLGGRYVLRPVFRFVASLHSQELFTATALLLVVGTALLVSQVGLSMALGAFLAGVLLADSEYRHELEADIEPFKGLLLGLFFIAVGMSVNLRPAGQRPRDGGGAGARAGAWSRRWCSSPWASGAFKSNEPGAAAWRWSSPRAASSPSCSSGSRWASG